ncbi:hypothetical protein VTK56DRAFT_1366 [Thermocarpiscus australiensis]
MSLRGSFAQAVTKANLRTIYLKVTPAPANLSERRAVLRALKQHGEIEVFKRLNDPSSFLSVVASHITALGIIAGSPLQFDYVTTSRHTSAAAAGSLAEPETSTKTFTVSIFEEPEYKHRTHIRASPLYGRWALPQEHPFLETSLARAALRRFVPRDMSWAGLVDWETCGQLEGLQSRASWVPTRDDFVAARQMRRAQEGTYQSLLDMFNARNSGQTERPRETAEAESEPSSA